MTIMYEVGLNDSPMSIARKLTGNPRQHVELLAANPHKPIVYVRGIPTFASLGVGERINVPPGFVGGDFDDLPPVERTEAVFTDPQIAQQREEQRQRRFETHGQRERAAARDIKLRESGDFFDWIATAAEDIGGFVVETARAAVETTIDIATAPARLALDIASGARIDRAVLKAAKDQVRIVRDVAPYAQTVISLVPGIGTGVSAAVSAGIAIAEGRDLDEIAKAAIRGALPGGPIAAAAFDAAIKVAQGKNVGEIALESARDLIPPGPGRQAFDIGLAVATGENLQNVLADELAQFSETQLRSIGSDWLKTASPTVVDAVSMLPEEVSHGSTLAMGMLSQEGMSPKALRAVRQKLSDRVRDGFDRAIRAAENGMPGITAALSPPSAAPTARKPPTLRRGPSPKAKADLEKLAKLSPKEQEELRQLVALKKLSPKEQEDLRQLAALKKLSPEEQEQLRQLAALKKLSPEEQEALAAMSPEERAQLRELELAKLGPKEQEDLRKLAEAKSATPAPTAPRAFQYGPYPQA